jgi:methylmalonyl-CoA mutase N-terminal domain/subunit
LITRKTWVSPENSLSREAFIPWASGAETGPLDSTLGFGTPQQTNERFKLMIAHGQTGLNVAFDLPTQMGYDSDDPMAEGEVGRVGMAVDSLQDFEIAFKDIKLNKIGSGLTINAVASIMLAMYQSVAEKFGYKKGEISATPQNDILKEMVGRGAWIYPVEPAVRLIGDTIEYSMKELPRCNPVSVCGYHIRESGCTPVQEISYAFEIAFAYIDEVVKRGYKAEECVGGFTFNLNIFGNLWETVAKFRRQGSSGQNSSENDTECRTRKLFS